MCISRFLPRACDFVSTDYYCFYLIVLLGCSSSASSPRAKVAPSFRRFGEITGMGGEFVNLNQEEIEMVQSLSRVLIHITFSTKERKSFITDSVAKELYPFISAHLDTFRCLPISIGGHVDHLHILCALYRTITIAKLVEEIKVSTSKFIKEGFNNPQFYWQKGYAVFSVSESKKDSVVRYIKNQKQHHAAINYMQELQTILKENSIPYSEQYLF